MELWIRSQDRRHLLKVDEINWFGGEIYTNDKVDLETTKDGKTYLLGRYNNGKRALEVLDEIQNILVLKDMYKYDRELVLEGWTTFDKEKVKMVRKQMSIYEMPKE